MLLLFVIFGSFSWTRSILTRFFPASGQGPSKEQRDAGMFVHTVVGFSTSSVHNMVSPRLSCYRKVHHIV